MLLEFASSTFLHELLGCICEELEQKDNTYPLFYGSWDWHSCVHGYWASLWLSQYLEDEQKNEWLIRRIEEGLQQELDMLEKQPSFELPYGRAWLLRLILEFEKQTHTSIVVDHIVISLKEWLNSENHSNVECEYKNPIWVLLQMWDWYQYKNDQEGLTFCQQKAQELLKNPPSLEEDFLARPAFFSCWSLWILLSDKMSQDTAILEQYQRVTKEDIRVVTSIQEVHQLGLNPSRAWGFAVSYRRSQEKRWLHAYRAHLLYSEQLTEKYKRDRYAYRHWVPQFIVYAIWLGGQPRKI